MTGTTHEDALDVALAAAKAYVAGVPNGTEVTSDAINRSGVAAAVQAYATSVAENTEWGQPRDRPHRLWMVVYDDLDRNIAYFDGADAEELARGQYARSFNLGFSCSLFAVQPASPLEWISEANPATPAAHWREVGDPDFHGNRYNCERAALFGGQMTDDELGDAVFLSPNIQNLTAAKDRIRWLSRALVAATAIAEAADDAKSRLESFASAANAGHAQAGGRELMRKIWGAFAEFTALRGVRTPRDGSAI